MNIMPMLVNQRLDFEVVKGLLGDINSTIATTENIPKKKKSLIVASLFDTNSVIEGYLAEKAHLLLKQEWRLLNMQN